MKSTPARVAEQIITEYFEKEELDIDELNSLVDSVVDGVKMSNCKAKVVREQRPSGHSFEAVA